MTEQLTAAVQLPPEVEHGNTEYKLKLVHPTPERLDHLTSQLKWRLAEGNGKAFYEIGVQDDGTPLGLMKKEMNATLASLRQMAKNLDVLFSVVRFQLGNSPGSKVARVLFRRKPARRDPVVNEVKLGMFGLAGSGKSTSIGVITTGYHDNGQGLARVHVLRHKHEMDNGSTSSVSTHVLGFDGDGKPTTREESVPSSVLVAHDWEKTLGSSRKLVRFLDFPGNPRFLKSTMNGLACYRPDFVAITVAADQLRLMEEQSHQTELPHRKLSTASELAGGGTSSGWQTDGGGSPSAGDAPESPNLFLEFQSHIKLAAALGLPYFVLVTKSDLVAAHGGFVGGQSICSVVEDMLNRPIPGMCPQGMVRVLDCDAPGFSLEEAAAGMVTSQRCGDGKQFCTMGGEHPSTTSEQHPSTTSEHSPSSTTLCFVTSNTTGHNIDRFTEFLNLLPGPVNRQDDHESPVFHILDTYDNLDELGDDQPGPIVAGVLSTGVVNVGDALSLGPMYDGSFLKVGVSSIHTGQSFSVARLLAGQNGSFALKSQGVEVSRESIPSGAVMVGKESVDVVSQFVGTIEHTVTFRNLMNKTARKKCTVKANSHFALHANGIQQTVKVISAGESASSNGTFEFAFENKSEYLPIDTKFLIRNGYTVFVGVVVANGK